MVTSTMGSYYQYATDFYVGGIYGGQTTYAQGRRAGLAGGRRRRRPARDLACQASAKINRENDAAKRRKVIEEAIQKMFAKYPKK